MPDRTAALKCVPLNACRALQYSDDVAADLLVLGSLQLAKSTTDGNTMGSVSAAAAKKSTAHILVAKGFGGF